MRQDIKQLWIDALRSNNYKQARHELVHQNDQGIYEHCALGVLCDIAVQKGVITQTPLGYRAQTDPETYGESAILPKAVADWAKLRSRDPYTKYELDSELVSDLNDKRRLSFDEIASILEEDLSI